jgi:hypothetical protein
MFPSIFQLLPYAPERAAQLLPVCASNQRDVAIFKLPVPSAQLFLMP